MVQFLATLLVHFLASGKYLTFVFFKYFDNSVTQYYHTIKYLLTMSNASLTKMHRLHSVLDISEVLTNLINVFVVYFSTKEKCIVFLACYSVILCFLAC